MRQRLFNYGADDAGSRKGTTIHVKTSGNQAKEVMEALEKLLDNKFGEE